MAKRKKKNPKQRFAMDLFCGAGGATQGILDTGLYRVQGYDNWEPCFYTHTLNEMPMILCDLNKRLPSTKSKVDLIWSSCPCQPFTNAVENDGRFDPRDGFPAYLRALKRHMPRLTIFENVAGLTYKRHSEYLATIVREIEELGYRVEMRVIDTADYGVPQHRRRLILIGRLDGKKPKFPKPVKRHVTVREAIGDGKKNPKGVAVRYAKNPNPAEGYAGSLLFNGRGRPLDLDRPSKTIYASGGNHVHWFDTKGVARPYWEGLTKGEEPRSGKVKGARRLTTEQMAAIQGFPKSFQFSGPPSIQVQQIGNAVPPAVATALVLANA